MNATFLAAAVPPVTGASSLFAAVLSAGGTWEAFAGDNMRIIGFVFVAEACLMVGLVILLYALVMGAIFGASASEQWQQVLDALAEQEGETLEPVLDAAVDELAERLGDRIFRAVRGARQAVVDEGADAAVRTQEDPAPGSYAERPGALRTRQ